jgi:hypothetical protein
MLFPQSLPRSDEQVAESVPKVCVAFVSIGPRFSKKPGPVRLLEQFELSRLGQIP